MKNPPSVSKCLHSQSLHGVLETHKADVNPSMSIETRALLSSEIFLTQWQRQTTYESQLYPTFHYFIFIDSLLHTVGSYAVRTLI